MSQTQQLAATGTDGTRPGYRHPRAATPQPNAYQRIPFHFNPMPVSIQRPETSRILSHAQKSVLFALVALTNRDGRPEDGIVHPAATVARWAGCSCRTVTRALPRLAELGLISLQRVAYGNKMGPRYVYRTATR